MTIPRKTMTTMKTPLKEWEQHILHTHQQKKGLSWCGETVAGQWNFQNLDHAAYCIINNSRIQPCPECVKVATEAFKSVLTWGSMTKKTRLKIIIGLKAFTGLMGTVGAIVGVFDHDVFQEFFSLFVALYSILTILPYLEAFSAEASRPKAS